MISEKQIKLIKEKIDELSRSEEQFIIMIFKNPDGTDHVTSYCCGLPVDKLKYYLRKEINRGEIITDKHD